MDRSPLRYQRPHLTTNGFSTTMSSRIAAPKLGDVSICIPRETLESDYFSTSERTSPVFERLPWTQLPTLVTEGPLVVPLSCLWNSCFGGSQCLNNAFNIYAEAISMFENKTADKTSSTGRCARSYFVKHQFLVSRHSLLTLAKSFSIACPRRVRA